MKINDEVTIDIEKIINTGVAMGHFDGLVVFVQGGCPDDKLKVKITKMNKNYATAELIEVITPSPHRVKPFCPMQKVCGACQLQHIDYNYQLKIKQQITDETIKSMTGVKIPVFKTLASPNNRNYRHKIQYPVSQTKNSKRILAGYFKPKSHEIVNIKYCPIQPEICDSIIEYIRGHAFNFGINGFNEKKHSGELRHIVIRASKYNQKILVTLVVNATKSFDRLEDFAKAIYHEFDEICGVCINFNSKKTNVILGDKTKCVIGSDHIEEKILDKTFKIGPNTFFQVNPQSAENIFSYVKNYITNNFKSPIVLDAYAGITTFGICICDVCKKVVSVEENKASCDLAAQIIAQNKINNIEINNMDASKFFSKEKRKFDIIILDPPRKGCSEESLNNAFRLTKKTIIYVSCNPATLARDLKHLINLGCQVESVQPVDMFCHTYHVENIAIIHKTTI